MDKTKEQRYDILGHCIGKIYFKELWEDCNIHTFISENKMWIFSGIKVVNVHGKKNLKSM